jgi:hypothetical protein
MQLEGDIVSTVSFFVSILSLTNWFSSKSQPKQSAGHEKFAPLDNPLTPFSIPAWAAVLHCVDCHPVSHQSSHYVFLDPGLFVSPAADKKKAKFIETWLQVCAAWIVRVVHNLGTVHVKSGVAQPSFERLT